jgi:hypothetical protein
MSEPMSTDGTTPEDRKMPATASVPKVPQAQGRNVEASTPTAASAPSSSQSQAQSLSTKSSQSQSLSQHLFHELEALYDVKLSVTERRKRASQVRPLVTAPDA